MLPKKRILALLLLTSVLDGCRAKDDKERYNTLERLRVMALRSEPADLAPGESATLSALVYQPENAPITYEWSWCPARGGSNDGYECAISEGELRAIWESLDTGVEFPGYGLGTEATADFTHVLSLEIKQAVCSAWASSEGADESAALMCLMGLQPSVQLIVRSDGEEIVALKDLHLLDGGSKGGDTEQRNANPEVSTAITLALQIGGGSNNESGNGPGRGSGDDDGQQYEEIEAGSTLEGNKRYKITVGVDEDQAETFLPEKREGLEPPTERKESLFLTWFVTMGGAEQRTSFIDGHTDFKDLIDNHWELPHTPLENQAKLFLVLRDERGGVGWTEHVFDVTEAE